MLFKSCPRCHSDLGRESFLYLGIMRVEWYCLACARLWDEDNLLDILREGHVNCCSVERQAVILANATRLLRGRDADTDKK